MPKLQIGPMFAGDATIRFDEHEFAVLGLVPYISTLYLAAKARHGDSLAEELLNALGIEIYCAQNDENIPSVKYWPPES
jgi:hypothetical protein